MPAFLAIEPKGEKSRFLLARGSILLLAALLASCSLGGHNLTYTPADSANWTTPRANAANTGRVPGETARGDLAVLWSAKTGGTAACEPVVRDGLIFFSGLDRRIEVFDAATGDRRFRKRFDGPVLGVIPTDSTFEVLTDQDERRYIIFDLKSAKEKSSFRVPIASAPPRRLSDTSVVIGTWDGRLICMRLDGTRLWDAEGEGPIMGAPALHDSLLYASSGRSVVAFRAADGERVWEHGRPAPVVGAPSVDERVYFGAADSFVTALNAANGDLAWSVRLGGGIYATPVLGDKLLYVGANDGQIYALDKATGATRWTYNTEAVANLSPTLVGDLLYVAKRRTGLAVLDAATGEIVWSNPLAEIPSVTSAVVVGSRILLASSNRQLLCLEIVDSTATLESASE